MSGGSSAVEVTQGDFEQAAGVLGRAFLGTEQWIRMVPNDEKRPELLAGMFERTLRMVAAAGGLSEHTNGFEGAALWFPPGIKPTMWSAFRAGYMSPRWLFAQPFGDTRRMMRVLSWFEGFHPKLVPDPHWYLMALGVDPEFHGRGFGSELVRAGIERADRDRVAIYLETETDENVGFYERLGFDVLETAVNPDIDLSFAFMARQPN